MKLEIGYGPEVIGTEDPKKKKKKKKEEVVLVWLVYTHVYRNVAIQILHQSKETHFSNVLPNPCWLIEEEGISRRRYKDLSQGQNNYHDFSSLLAC